MKKIVFGNFKFLPTQWHFCNKTVYFFSVKWLIFMTSNGSVNFSLQFKTVYRFLSWKIRILAFSHFHTWESSILLNLTNYFHHFSLGSAKSTHFNDFPSSIACFLQVSTVSYSQKVKQNCQWCPPASSIYKARTSSKKSAKLIFLLYTEGSINKQGSCSLKEPHGVIGGKYYHPRCGILRILKRIFCLLMWRNIYKKHL